MFFNASAIAGRFKQSNFLSDFRILEMACPFNKLKRENQEFFRRHLVGKNSRRITYKITFLKATIMGSIIMYVLSRTANIHISQ